MPEKQPTLQTNVLNGKSVIRFNPGADINSNNDALALSSIVIGNSTASSYAVVKREDNDQSMATGRDRILAGSHGGYHFGAFDDGANPFPIGVEVGQTGISGVVTTVPVDDRFLILGARVDGAQAVVSLWNIDGSLLASETYPLIINGFADTPYMVGARPDFPTGNQSLDGDLAELLFYKSFLSPTDESAVVQYLVGRYFVPEPGSVALAGLAPAIGTIVG